MWFWLSLTTLLFWSGADLFCKVGCRSTKEKYSHYTMVIAVGVVMGLHALYQIFVQKITVDMQIIWIYLPVAFLYIISMTIGYVGLKYIELSISSPICNSSGALVAVMTIATALATGQKDVINIPQIIAIIVISVGVIGLGVVESKEDEELRSARQEASNYKYAKSWLAIGIPIIYCIIDAAGTFFDNYAIEKVANYLNTTDLDLAATTANVAYELTFLVMGIIAFIYVVIIKKDKLVFKQEVPKYIGASFETIGQFSYILAVADKKYLAMSAPIISSFCALSVLLSRIFLKEKLSLKHYLMISLVVVGIAILGFLEEVG